MLRLDRGLLGGGLSKLARGGLRLRLLGPRLSWLLHRCTVIILDTWLTLTWAVCCTGADVGAGLGGGGAEGSATLSGNSIIITCRG